MPKRQAITAADFAKGHNKENVRVLPDGSVELINNGNLLGNATLLNLDPEGNPDLWGALVGVPAPTGWHVYTDQGRQNRFLSLPLDDNFYAHPWGLLTGYPAPLIGSMRDVSAPKTNTAPSVSVVNPTTTLALTGVDGWVAVAFCWVLLDGTLTRPGPRIATDILDTEILYAEGLALESDAPAGVGGLAVCCTEEQGDEAAALDALTPLYVQEIIPIGLLTTDQFVYLTAPFSVQLAPLEGDPDPTAVGGFEQYGPVKWRISPAFGTGLPEGMVVDVSWRFYTASGVSAAQDTTTITITPEMADSGSSIEVRPPVLPSGALSWEPLWRATGVAGTNGRWKFTGQQYTDFRIYTQIMSRTILNELAALPTVDATGVESPTDPPILVQGFDASSFVSGTVKVRVTLEFGHNLESDASPLTSVSVPGGSTFRVERPAGANPALSPRCVVLENPVSRHADLVGIDLNFIEYFAPPGTPQGYRIATNAPSAVVEGGEQYTVSFYAFAEDISASTLFEMGFRDAEGTLLGTPVAVASLSAGDHAWARYDEQFTAPPGAVFLEVVGYNVGAGHIILGAPKIEVGSTPTAFDPDDVATSGQIIIVVDTGTQEDDISLPPGFFGGGVKVASGGVTISPEEGLSYDVSFASSAIAPETDPPGGWTYVDDLDDLVFNKYIAIKTVITEDV